MSVSLQFNNLAMCNSNFVINIVGQKKLFKNIFTFPFEPEKDITIYPA